MPWTWCLQLHKYFYDVFSWIMTVLAANYLAISFQSLAFDRSWRIYKSFYFAGHIVCLLLWTFVKLDLLPKKKVGLYSNFYDNSKNSWCLHSPDRCPCSCQEDKLKKKTKTKTFWKQKLQTKKQITNKRPFSHSFLRRCPFLNVGERFFFFGHLLERKAKSNRGRIVFPIAIFL